MNVHIPERLKGETFEAYKERRKESKRRVKIMRVQGKVALLHFKLFSSPLG